ncbi:gamma-glutamyl-gamma-aminobutyrate hydrolase family protein [Roseicitreum antarcticum]|uniref:Putative glutamine amidotransferase n=1 Tax=Roseicitreum antarcticum TaxID=564137 RepID=A0A1H2QNA4_9RHOB|nr:type 1 glutamine amidotransferase [Roseicitreum antarcticum]SDW08687.1 putative glutamine amidotransferase [Roseicitreum antarcticum]
MQHTKKPGTPKPCIGVTVSARTGWRVFPFMALNVWLAGGTAIRWDSRKQADMTAVDGLIVGGGDDISPELYKGELVASARLDPKRDALERRLVLEAFAAGKPVLGICRGAQMINIAQGGNLHQRAYDHYTDSRYLRTILPRKSIIVAAGTTLAALAGTQPMRVNALHTQAVDRLADGLRIAARDEGGMVQAVERAAPPFAIGVQWHPEYLIYARRQRALFRALVEAARA